MHYRFTPTDGLKADARYRLAIRGLTDLEGGADPGRVAPGPHHRGRSRRPVPPARRHARCRSRRRPVGPLHDGDGSGQHGQGVQGRRGRQGRRRQDHLGRGRHRPHLQAGGAPAVLHAGLDDGRRDRRDRRWHADRGGRARPVPHGRQAGRPGHRADRAAAAARAARARVRRSAVAAVPSAAAAGAPSRSTTWA